MRNDDVQDLLEQLNRLQIQQTDLFARLATAVEAERAQTREPLNERKPAKREFAIGDRVNIKNPKLFQPTSGTITKIGATRITVTSESGSKILRAPKNIVFER